MAMTMQVTMIMQWFRLVAIEATILYLYTTTSYMHMSKMWALKKWCVVLTLLCIKDTLQLIMF